MNELALFAGAGGGILGGLLLGWRTVCAVEIDSYCRRVLFARQRDSILPRFPIWDDVRTFDGKPWRGYIDVISGGFPCQAFSSAARGRNNAVDLWPEMLRVCSEVSPPWVFAENVAEKAIAKAAEDLSGIGYKVRYQRFTATPLACPHPRPRWFVVAYSDGFLQRRCSFNDEVASVQNAGPVDWWKDDAETSRVSDGLANRMDRFQAIGNGQIPAMVRVAWTELRGHFA